MRRPQLALLAAAIAVVALAGIAVIALDDDGGDERVGTETAGATTATTAPVVTPSSTSAPGATPTSEPVASTALPPTADTEPAPSAEVPTTTRPTPASLPSGLEVTGTVAEGRGEDGQLRVDYRFEQTSQSGLFLVTLVADTGSGTLGSAALEGAPGSGPGGSAEEGEGLIADPPSNLPAPHVVELAWTVAFTEPGPHDLTLRVRGGGADLEVALPFTVDVGAAAAPGDGPDSPRAHLDPWTEPHPADEDVVLRNDLGGPDATDGCLREKTFDFGDGSPPVVLTPEPGAGCDEFGPVGGVFHRYAPGTYRVRSTVTSTAPDGTGLQYGSIVRTLVVN